MEHSTSPPPRIRQLPAELLSAVPTLLAAADGSSATQAATALGTTATTVLRRIEAAEAVLQVRLFERMPTGLAPTPALYAMLPWAEQIAAGIDGMQREAAALDAGVAGTVRVAVPPMVAELFLVPHLPVLTRDSGLTVEFAAANEIVHLGRLEADIAIRVARPESGDFMLKKLADFEMCVAASPSLATAAPGSLSWLAWDRQLSHLPESRWLTAAFPDADIVLRASELGILLTAARHSLGAVVVAEPIAAAMGGLVPVEVDGPPLAPGSLWIVTHRALRSVPRVTAVVDWIVSCFERQT